MFWVWGLSMVFYLFVICLVDFGGWLLLVVCFGFWVSSIVVLNFTCALCGLGLLFVS